MFRPLVALVALLDCLRRRRPFAEFDALAHARWAQMVEDATVTRELVDRNGRAA